MNKAILIFIVIIMQDFFPYWLFLCFFNLWKTVRLRTFALGLLFPLFCQIFRGTLYNFWFSLFLLFWFFRSRWRKWLSKWFIWLLKQFNFVSIAPLLIENIILFFFIIIGYNSFTCFVLLLTLLSSSIRWWLLLWRAYNWSITSCLSYKVTTLERICVLIQLQSCDHFFVEVAN